MTTIAEAITIALEHHQAGRLDEAEAIYRQVIAVDPQQCDALHLLGAIANQRGQHETAVELIRRALAIRPMTADYYGNLGLAYDALRNEEQAIACYRRAVELDPDFAVGWVNLGGSLLAAGICGVEGEFERGDTVSVLNRERDELARGITRYDCEEIARIMGCRSEQIAERLGHEYGPAVVHRNDLILV